MDTKLLESLYWKGVLVFDMGSHMTYEHCRCCWGSPTFHKMWREKVILIDSILPFGFEGLMCDTDMVWLKVMPPLWRRLDRLWYPHFGVLEGSSTTRQPFLCPLDHVFELRGKI